MDRNQKNELSIDSTLTAEKKITGAGSLRHPLQAEFIVGDYGCGALYLVSNAAGKELLF